jgi:hypothetical protein
MYIFNLVVVSNVILRHIRLDCKCVYTSIFLCVCVLFSHESRFFAALSNLFSHYIQYWQCSKDDEYVGFLSHV